MFEFTAKYNLLKINFNRCVKVIIQLIFSIKNNYMELETNY